MATWKNAKQKTDPKKSSTKCCGCVEDPLKELAKTGILANFVKKNNGCWNHQQWLELCADISKKGFSSIDFDQVGLILEKEKAEYLN